MRWCCHGNRWIIYLLFFWGLRGREGKMLEGLGLCFVLLTNFVLQHFKGPHCQDSRQSSCNTAFTKSFIMHLRLHHSNWNMFQVDRRAPAQNFFQVKHRDVRDTRENSEESQATDMCAVQPLRLDGSRDSCRGIESRR